MVNDTSTAITYSGSSWYYQNHRGAGEFNNDIHSTTANGDSFTGYWSEGVISGPGMLALHDGSPWNLPDL
jgi:hypothetical protein